MQGEGRDTEVKRAGLGSLFIVKLIADMFDTMVKVKMIAGMLGVSAKMIGGRLIVSHCPGWGLASLSFHLHRAINDHFIFDKE
jgi:hypothetical protein